MRDAPNYRPAKLAVMGTQAGCALITVLLYVYYRWQNRKKDQLMGKAKVGEEGFMSKETWGTRTDREDGEFRYCY